MKFSLKKLFSVKNDGVYKVVILCGLKFKIKSKYNKLQERLNEQQIIIDRLAFMLTQGINKDKAAYDFDRFKGCGINDNTRTPRIVVSLTSYPGRMYDIHYCLYSLLNQTTKPDEVVLWLAEEEFPNKEADLPQKVLKLKDNGLTIKWCKNTGSYKKLIPALKEYPQDIIVTADDDIYYPSDWLEKLYNSYLENPECISAHRVHKITFDSTGGIEPYEKWLKIIYDDSCEFINFSTTGGGVLYPPDCFYKDVCNEDLFMQLAPKADDVWFWAMCVMNNKKIKVVKNPINEILYINTYREMGINKDETTLFSSNRAGGNDEQIKNVINAYPQILNLLKQPVNSVEQKRK